MRSSFEKLPGHRGTWMLSVTNTVIPLSAEYPQGTYLPPPKSKVERKMIRRDRESLKKKKKMSTFKNR